MRGQLPAATALTESGHGLFRRRSILSLAAVAGSALLAACSSGPATDEPPTEAAPEEATSAQEESSASEEEPTEEETPEETAAPAVEDPEGHEYIDLSGITIEDEETGEKLAVTRMLRNFSSQSDPYPEEYVLLKLEWTPGHEDKFMKELELVYDDGEDFSPRRPIAEEDAAAEGFTVFDTVTTTATAGWQAFAARKRADSYGLRIIRPIDMILGEPTGYEQEIWEFEVPS